MKFREATLSNGLEIVAECNDRAYSTALAFFVKTGSRDETADVAGVSHFLEHMTFKGTPRRSAADVNRELDEIGSHSNAYTSEEQTVYYATVLPEYQDQALDILADIMRPSLRQEDFDTEKQVIIEEILKYEDQPPFGAHEKCMALYFQQHPLGNSVLGSVQSVGQLTCGSMHEYFRNRYSPGNMALVAAGRVDFERLVREAQTRCGHWPAFVAPRATPPATGRSEFQTVVKETATQQYAVQLSAGPDATDADRFASRILATIVGDDTGSRLFWELVDPGLAECAAVGAYEFQGTGVLMTFLCCDPDRAGENLQRIVDVQRAVQSNGVTADELELARNKICSHLVRSSERPSNRLFSVGNGWLQRRSYQTVKERLAAYQRVDLNSISDILRKYPLTLNTTLTVGPLDWLPRPG